MAATAATAFLVDSRRFDDNGTDAIEVLVWAPEARAAEDFAGNYVAELAVGNMSGDWQCVDVLPSEYYSRHRVWAVTFYAV